MDLKRTHIPIIAAEARREQAEEEMEKQWFAFTFPSYQERIENGDHEVEP
jgi:hypothetical protein